MNKVDEEDKVDRALNIIRTELSETHAEGWATGLALWKYQSGVWEWAHEYLFGNPIEAASSLQAS